MSSRGSMDSQRTVRLAAFPSFGKNAPYYLGLESGMYAGNGVDLSLINAYEGATELVASGRADLAQDLCATAAAAISEGAPLVIVGVRDGILPAGTVSLSSSGIQSPRDYPGKSWGDSVGSSETALMTALGGQFGFSIDSIRFVNLDFDQRLPALLQGQVDMVSGWYGSGYAAFKVAAEKQGQTLRFVSWSDHGLDIYGQCYIASRAWVDSHEDVLRGFFNANRAAFHMAIVDPDQAIVTTQELTATSGTDPAIIAEAWREASEIFVDRAMQERGYFWVDGEKLNHSLHMINPSAAQQTDVSTLFTNKYLEVG